MRFFYGNRSHELVFDVRVNKAILEELQELGFLDEEIDINWYFDNFDVDNQDEYESGIVDAFVDYYSDRADSYLEEQSYKMDCNEPYDEEFMELNSDLERIEYVADLYDFRHLNHGVGMVTVREWGE